MKKIITTSLLAILFALYNGLVAGSPKANAVDGKSMTSKEQLYGHTVSPTDHGVAEKESRELVIGGREALAGDYPYLALLFIYIDGYDGVASCGGTLIAPNWILTVAHCVEGALLITAVLGLNNVTDLLNEFNTGEVEVHLIDTSVVHPDYTNQEIDGDFALLYLNDPSNKTSPQINFDFYTPAIDDEVLVVGWGLTSDYQYNSSSDVPMETFLTVVSQDACKLAYADYIYQITTSMQCATGRGKTATCYGDSGGPVIVKSVRNASEDILVGVVSWGSTEGCVKANRPDVYSRVSSALSWIFSTIEVWS